MSAITPSDLDAFLARSLEPIPVCARKDCGVQLLDVRRGARYCSEDCQRAANNEANAAHARAYRKRKRVTKLSDRAHLLDVANSLIEQTRKRAKGMPVSKFMTGENLAAALLKLPERDRDQVIQVVTRSPETTKRDDAMHVRENVPTAEFEGALELSLVDADPDILWCHRNRAAAVLVGGSLGYVPRSSRPPKCSPRTEATSRPLTITYGPPQEKHAGEDRPEPTRFHESARSVLRAHRAALRGCALDDLGDDWRGDPWDPGWELS